MFASCSESCLKTELRTSDSATGRKSYENAKIEFSVVKIFCIMFQFLLLIYVLWQN